MYVTKDLGDVRLARTLKNYAKLKARPQPAIKDVEEQEN
jgi:hypothetical protein